MSDGRDPSVYQAPHSFTDCPLIVQRTELIDAITDTRERVILMSGQVAVLVARADVVDLWVMGNSHEGARSMLKRHDAKHIASASRFRIALQFALSVVIVLGGVIVAHLLKQHFGGTP